MYKEGMKVKINDYGVEIYGGGRTNPQNVVGVVVSGNEPGWFGVNWPNDTFNEYQAGTLDIVDGE